MSMRSARTAALPRRRGLREPAWATGRAFRTITQSCRSRAASTAGMAPCAACGCACLPSQPAKDLDYYLHCLCDPRYCICVHALLPVLRMSSSLHPSAVACQLVHVALIFMTSMLNWWQKVALSYKTQVCHRPPAKGASSRRWPCSVGRRSSCSTWRSPANVSIWLNSALQQRAHLSMPKTCSNSYWMRRTAPMMNCEAAIRRGC